MTTDLTQALAAMKAAHAALLDGTDAAAILDRGMAAAEAALAGPSLAAHNPGWLCSRCYCAMPAGCLGIFRDDGPACRLNNPTGA